MRSVHALGALRAVFARLLLASRPAEAQTASTLMCNTGQTQNPGSLVVLLDIPVIRSHTSHRNA